MRINTDLKVHGDGSFSIKDFDGDIEISGHKWDYMFVIFNKLFDNVYFYGNRRWGSANELEQILSYLVDEVLINEGINHFNILFKIKESFVYDNRKLLSILWQHYEFPSFIFLADKKNQSILVDLYKKNVALTSIINNLDDALMIYRHIELDVLWFKTTIDDANFLKLIQ